MDTSITRLLRVTMGVQAFKQSRCEKPGWKEIEIHQHHPDGGWRSGRNADKLDP